MLCLASLSAGAGEIRGLGRNAPGYLTATPGVELAFPRDYGAHPGFRVEWWYLTANLHDRAGAAYGAQWTLFRVGLAPGPEGTGWESGAIFMGHAAATSASEHLFAETFARGGIGQAGVSAEPFEAFIDDWSMKAPGEGISRLSVAAEGNGFSYKLALTSEKGPVAQGDRGYSQKSETGQASYYFSEPFYAVEGEIRLHGKPVRVSGRAWMDREWSGQYLAPEQKGWDWFALHLPGNEKLMLFRLRSVTGRNFLTGNWISATGESQQLGPGDISIEPLAETRLEAATLPTRWRLGVRSHGLDIETAPLNPSSWMGTRFPYWEGPISFSGSHQGEGYLEMTGYSQ
ncbi:iron ABC transporter permease [Methylocystis heyeri]|uniref:Iron ABC transporter permease n=2 Tax=Methylocystis heyeri TaxID=391905 RepID=A0A6B8KLZ6_9HYPH|nr:iron ABC transporter permease [Methylocystis heyeri]